MVERGRGDLLTWSRGLVGVSFEDADGWVDDKKAVDVGRISTTGERVVETEKKLRRARKEAEMDSNKPARSR